MYACMYASAFYTYMNIYSVCVYTYICIHIYPYTFYDRAARPGAQS